MVTGGRLKERPVRGGDNWCGTALDRDSGLVLVTGRDLGLVQAGGASLGAGAG